MEVDVKKFKIAYKKTQMPLIIKKIIHALNP